MTKPTEDFLGRQRHTNMHFVCFHAHACSYEHCMISGSPRASLRRKTLAEEGNLGCSRLEASENDNKCWLEMLND